MSHLAQVGGVELGLKHLGQVAAQRVVVLHAFTLFPVQPLQRQNGSSQSVRLVWEVIKGSFNETFHAYQVLSLGSGVMFLNYQKTVEQLYKIVTSLSIHKVEGNEMRQISTLGELYPLTFQSVHCRVLVLGLQKKGKKNTVKG